MAVDYVPREDAEQAALIAWANAQSGAYPALELLYHVPNEGNRGVIGGVKMANLGLKKGVPDLCLPVPSGDYHGMYVELKRRKGATPTQDQADWLKKLDGQGYCVCWCRGWEAAAKVIMDYLKFGGIAYSPTKGRGGEFHAGEV